MAKRWIVAGALMLFVGGALLIVMRSSTKLETGSPITGTAVLRGEIRAIPADWALPLHRAAERVTKKPFGIHITPTNSPIQPERFSGYHTGADFEIFDDEMKKDVAVRSISNGIVLEKRRAGGYGGVMVVSSRLDEGPVTIVYGHLRLTSIPLERGDSVRIGDRLGVLGDDQSDETDGERKHLHLSIHRGTPVNIRGYVNSPSELQEWIDPMTFIGAEVPNKP